MRERDVNRKMFHRGHYEVIAKRFREALDPYMNDAAIEAMAAENTQMYVKAELVAIRSAYISLAIDFARRLQADNEEFDPHMFLDRCSPNVEVYPLSALWQEEEGDGNSNGNISS